MRICVFDLDKTLTDRASFTSFLMFGARRVAVWRLALAPLWILMLLGYKLRLYDRTTLKRRGMALLIGSGSYGQLDQLGRQFGERLAQHIQPGAQDRWNAAGEAGDVRIIATAAFAFYAEPFGAIMGADHVIATPFDTDGHIPGGNNYGATKLARLTDWLAQHGPARGDVHIVAASDSFADAPMLDWADEAYFVTRNPRVAARAEQRGWHPVDFGLRA